MGAAGICGLKNFDEACDYTNQQPPQRGGAVSNPVGLSRNGYWPPFRFQIPLVLLTPNIFLQCCPLNDRRRAACIPFKIGRLSFLFCSPGSSPSYSSDMRQCSSKSWSCLSLFCVQLQRDLEGQVTAILYLFCMVTFRLHLPPFGV